MEGLTEEEIKEINEYYGNVNVITGMRELLYSYGYLYDDRHGWYFSGSRNISPEDKSLAETIIKKLAILIKKNDQLKKQINIEL